MQDFQSYEGIIKVSYNLIVMNDLSQVIFVLPDHGEVVPGHGGEDQGPVPPVSTARLLLS